MLAIFKIRAVPININYRYVEAELRYLFDNADLVGLVYREEFGPRVAAVIDELPAAHDPGDDPRRFGRLAAGARARWPTPRCWPPAPPSATSGPGRPTTS